ncbi:ATP-binding cassette domain-containing protein [Amycolatopsis sp. RM579]|uniref:Fatty acid ABC transporter ATP-binding/permease protein n=2 Tax=Amycolatopsis pithecellobii TaxID=664692 RepID=A0A6N7Z250_9PSEU|nr:ABC transporter ATP-binding protein [Amycolatopsis pithecellobii]MTD53900.1 ATP-binding cassette domain-containing protein [Amycolatopsis pithecellobii]
MGRGMPGMGMPPAKAKSFGPSAKRLVGRLRPERFAFIVVIALGVTSVAFNVAGPKLLGDATDVIFQGVLQHLRHVPGGGIDFAALGQKLSWVLGLYLASSVFGWAQGRLLNRVVQKVVFGLREEVEAKLHRLPLRYFDGQPRGELLSRVTNDIDNISSTLQQTLSQLMTSVLTVLGVIVMMLTISPLLAVIALAVIPISVLVTGQIGKRSQKLFIAQWKHTGTLNAHIEESFTGHQLVKVFGRQRESEEEFRRRNDELFEAARGAQFVSGLIMPAMMFLSNLSYVVVAVVGGLRITSGAMTLGEVQAFIQYSRQFTQPLTQIASMANLMQSGVASAERVFELLDAEEQEPDATGSNAASLPAERRGRVEFTDVSFAYRPEQPLIEHLSLVAEPGQTVAIVGPTGAGKTTLVNLIMRFYELDAGRITLDGVDITHLRRQDLRGQIGMVLQDTWLFGGTIRDNIAYGKPDATEDQIVAAAKATFVDRFVRTLPDGYDTVIDEEGTNVSAGEKQLLTIARAFLASPSLLILDEATSSVDTRTEALVQKAMAALRSSRTSFVIAHRLSTIRDADLILVMESGQIVEQGTHDELLEAKGAYYRLYSAQFAAAAS